MLALRLFLELASPLGWAKPINNVEKEGVHVEVAQEICNSERPADKEYNARRIFATCCRGRILIDKDVQHVASQNGQTYGAFNCNQDIPLSIDCFSLYEVFVLGLTLQKEVHHFNLVGNKDLAKSDKEVCHQGEGV